MAEHSDAQLAALARAHLGLNLTGYEHDHLTTAVARYEAHGALTPTDRSWVYQVVFRFMETKELSTTPD